MMQHPIYLDAMSLITPGIETTDQLRGALDGTGVLPDVQGWQAVPNTIPSRTKRRLSSQTLMAILVAEHIAPTLPDTAAWVFGSSAGEGDTLKSILDALSTPTMAVRPFGFQNSVHNAASGQWSIVAGVKNAVTSICGGQNTAGSALLKAALQVSLENIPVGLILYDTPLPFPLDASHQINRAAGAGFALSPRQTKATLARLELSLCDDTRTPVTTEFARQVIATQNPVFATMGLVERLMGIADNDVVLALNGGQGLRLRIDLL